MQEWLTAELRGLDLGDKRLNKRQAIVLDKLAANPRESLPGATCSWAELLAAYRFCDNKRVTSEKVLSPHRAATIERIRCHAVVLIPQDTTELVLDRDPEKGFGKLTSTIGLLDHVQIAVTPPGRSSTVGHCAGARICKKPQEFEVSRLFWSENVVPQLIRYIWRYLHLSLCSPIS